MQLRQAGAYTAGANVDCTSVPFAGFLIGVMATLGAAGAGTAPTGGIDILQNETSIYGATKLNFVAGATGATYQPLTPSDPLPVNVGDVFTLKTNGTWGTTQSKDLVVQLLFRRKNSPPAASYQGNFQTELGGEE